MADPTSFSTNSVNLVADTLPKVVVPTTYPTHWLQTLQFSGIQCKMRRIVWIIFHENIKHIKKGVSPEEKLINIFQDLTWNNTKPDKIENLSKNVLPWGNIDGLEPSNVNIDFWGTISHQTKSVHLNMQAKSPLQ